MVKFGLSFDIRAPDFGIPAPTAHAAALEMAQCADAAGFDYVSVLRTPWRVGRLHPRSVPARPSVGCKV
jgi:hypothetical protein